MLKKETKLPNIWFKFYSVKKQANPIYGVKSPASSYLERVSNREGHEEGYCGFQTVLFLDLAGFLSVFALC